LLCFFREGVAKHPLKFQLDFIKVSFLESLGFISNCDSHQNGLGLFIVYWDPIGKIAFFVTCDVDVFNIPPELLFKLDEHLVKSDGFKLLNGFCLPLRQLWLKLNQIIYKNTDSNCTHNCICLKGHFVACIYILTDKLDFVWFVYDLFDSRFHVKWDLMAFKFLKHIVYDAVVASLVPNKELVISKFITSLLHKVMGYTKAFRTICILVIYLDPLC
jgi:hypothetical protein